MIESWPWPGNLHELRAAIRYAAVQALIEEADEIERRHLVGEHDGWRS